MKLAPARVTAFLERPDPAIVAVLLYGPDAGLVAERGARLVRAIAGEPPDPFRSSELEPERVAARPALLLLEAQALSFTGGRRVVRLRDADDGLAAALRELLTLERAEALVVIEAGELGAGSKLRQLVERAPNAAAIGCWPEGERDRSTTVRNILAEHGLVAEPDALAWLADRLGADRGVMRGELDKLALYLADRSPDDRDRPGSRRATVRLEDAIAVVGDGSALALDDAIFAALAGDGTRLERDLARLLASGEAPVRILRAASVTILRVYRLQCDLERGTALEEALANARPPVHFRIKDRLVAAVRRWRSDRLAAALARLLEAELEIKSGGRPEDLVCRHALAELADHAAGTVTR